MQIDLQSLAQESSSEKRRELLNRVTDLFLDGAEDHNDREATLYADVALRVLKEISPSDRVDYAEAIADQAKIPGNVVKQLATDEIAVASPVLERSPVLSDNDLVEIAGNMSQEHLRAISSRPQLSEQVTDRLIERGDGEVHRTVSANTGARFSDEGLTKLTESGAEDETVRSNILGRRDLRTQLAEAVLPRVSGEYAEKLRGIIEKADDRLIEKVASSVEDAVQSGQRESAQQRLETRAIISELLAKTRDIDETIVYLGRQGRHTDIVTVLARLSGVAENIISNALFKTNNEPVAILCRSVGASATGFQVIQDMRASKLRLPQSHIEQGMREFAQIDEQTAKRSLRFVKVRASVA